MVYCELGAFPMNIFIKQRIANDWSRILHAKENKLHGDPSPNKVVSKVEIVDLKLPKQGEAKMDGLLNTQNNYPSFF